jgi:hypothetical protein
MSVTMTPTTPLFANAQYVYYCNSAIDLTGNGQNNGSAGLLHRQRPASASWTECCSRPIRPTA